MKRSVANWSASLTLFCGDRAAAEEIAQEALVRAWQRWDRLEHPRQWTYRTAFNLARYYADLTVAEAAVVMACAEGTVKALTSQAIANLRTAGLTIDQEEVPSAPIGGAFTVCTITHAVFAADEPGRDAAVDLAGRLAAAPGCALGSAPRTTATAAPSTTDGEAPSSSLQSHPIIQTLEDAGLIVSGVEETGPAITFEFQPRALQDGQRPSPVRVSLAPQDAPAPAVTAQTTLVQLAEGEGAVLPGSGLIAFYCSEFGLITTSGQGDGGSVLGWVEQLPQAIGCDPLPPGLSREVTADDGTIIRRFESIREARLLAAFETLGVDLCCGEPSHGGSGASSGMVWEGSDVTVIATAPQTADRDERSGAIIDLADGSASTSTADDVARVIFDCDDTLYVLAVDGTDPRVAVRAAEALVRQLACTPIAGPQ
ncbi:MAG: sigma factor [Euzebya sp.]